MNAEMQKAYSEELNAENSLQQLSLSSELSERENPGSVSNQVMVGYKEKKKGPEQAYINKHKYHKGKYCLENIS